MEHSGVCLHHAKKKFTTDEEELLFSFPLRALRSNLLMEPSEVRHWSSRTPPHTPAASQNVCSRDVQTETCTDSGEGTSGSVGHTNPEDQQKHVKKDEPEDEGYVCDTTPGPVEHFTPVEEQKYIKKEEPEDEDYLSGISGGQASCSVENVGEQSGVQSMHVKEEESTDEHFLCTTTVWEKDDAQLEVYPCFMCSLSSTSHTFLHKHITRCHPDEYERLIKSGDIMDVQTETCTDSRSVGHTNPEDQQKHVKKDEPEDEGYVCDTTPGPVEHFTPVEEQKYIKKEEPEDEDYLKSEHFMMESAEDHLSSFTGSAHPPPPAVSLLLGDVQTETAGGTSGSLGEKHVKKEEHEDEGYLCWMSSSVGLINPVDQQKHIKKEEPEGENNLHEEIGMGQITPVHLQSNRLQSIHIKEEESEDEGYACTSLCEMKDAQFQAFTCSWCSLSYTSQMYLHKHIRRCHYEQYKSLITSGEIPSW
ncbi:hypothetical protein KOW79_019793 [Hemibagrus wyckioides]|uniref:C2H2-type domain-containing protein n=1 Tax=Hemibagrus wyckioides TaxID=337641 RepID=A0A9D3SA03_9TELE|nr:hypothetical protein KOW79_019793 [Hemibagrus wyckioides]